MRKLFIPALASALLLNACGSDSETTAESTVIGTPVTTTPAGGATGRSSAPATLNQPLNLNGLAGIGRGGEGTNPEHGKPGHRCDIPVGAPLGTPANNNNTQASTPVSLPSGASAAQPQPATGLNPEHGKPGHRCDIAVGAPLNSKPNTTATASAKATTVSVPTVAPAKPGMNPQHGQPGHRCDIAVGAPLNSKPLQPAPPVPAPATPEGPAKADTSGQ